LADYEAMADKRVLICDDDPQLRAMASAWFTDNGWEVVGAVENAVAVVESARALRPDVVVLDVGLIGISGLDVIPELTETGAAVVVCSAFASAHEASERAGASAIVDKAELHTLLDVVNGLMLTREAPKAEPTTA
jgi:CheY-like chemotaxis protein